MQDNTSPRRDVGKAMISFLVAKSKRAKKSVGATTAELAKAADVPISQAYSRLYWLAFRTDPATLVVVSGKGNSRVWRLAAKELKANLPASPKPAKKDKESSTPSASEAVTVAPKPKKTASSRRETAPAPAVSDVSSGEISTSS